MEKKRKSSRRDAGGRSFSYRRSNALLDVNEDDDWEQVSAVGLGKVERAGVKRKLGELEEEGYAKGLKVPLSVAETFPLSHGLLGSVDAQVFMSKRATRVNREEKSEVKPETMLDERDRCHRVLTNAPMNEARENHACELNALHSLFKARESELSQARDKRLVERKQLRTERDEKSSSYTEVLSTVR